MRIRLLLLVLGLALMPRLAAAQVYVGVSMPGVVVRAAPPPVRVEVQPARPSPGHMWQAGHWAWRNGQHEWFPGRWALPPAPGYVWEPARWENTPGGYRFFEGHWRYSTPPAPTVVYEQPAPPAQEVYVQQAPPEPIVEVRPAVPFGGAVWIGGFWHWQDGRYHWVGGHWSGPRAGFHWVDHRWERGMDGRWHYAPGRWAR